MTAPEQRARKPLSDAEAYALYAVTKAKWDAEADEFNHWDSLEGDEIALLITREVESLHGIGEPSGYHCLQTQGGTYEDS